MLTTRQERITTRHSVTGAPRRRWVKLVVGGAAVVALVPFGAGVAAAPGWSNPFAQKTVDHTAAPLLTAMREVSQFKAATATFQVLVDLEHDTPNVPAIISGERTTFFATGRVDSVVDLSGLDEGRVVMSPDRLSVTISVPSPRLEAAAIDPAQSRVVGKQRGIVDRVTEVFDQAPRSDQELYVLAQRRIDAEAARSDLSNRAENSTRAMLTSMANSMGFRQVTVVFEPPTEPR